MSVVYYKESFDHQSHKKINRKKINLALKSKVILCHLFYSFNILSKCKPIVCLHEQICKSEPVLMTELLLV